MDVFGGARLVKKLDGRYEFHGGQTKTYCRSRVNLALPQSYSHFGFQHFSTAPLTWGAPLRAVPLFRNSLLLPSHFATGFQPVTLFPVGRLKIPVYRLC